MFRSCQAAFRLLFFKSPNQNTDSYSWALAKTQALTFNMILEKLLILSVFFICQIVMTTIASLHGVADQESMLTVYSHIAI